MSNEVLIFTGYLGPLRIYHPSCFGDLRFVATPAGGGVWCWCAGNNVVWITLAGSPEPPQRRANTVAGQSTCLVDV